jgi:hypothetical protein
VSDDPLIAAFKVLGSAPTAHEMELVGRALREAGDKRVFELFDRAAAEIDTEASDRPAYTELGAIAHEAGADPFTLLDLMVEVTNPDWQPLGPNVGRAPPPGMQSATARAVSLAGM